MHDEMDSMHVERIVVACMMRWIMCIERELVIVGSNFLRILDSRCIIFPTDHPSIRSTILLRTFSHIRQFLHAFVDTGKSTSLRWTTEQQLMAYIGTWFNHSLYGHIFECIYYRSYIWGFSNKNSVSL